MRRILLAVVVSLSIGLTVSTFAGILLVPFIAIAAVVSATAALAQLVGLRAVGAGPVLRSLGISAACVGVIVAAMMGFDHRVEVLKQDLQPVIERVEAEVLKKGAPPQDLYYRPSGCRYYSDVEEGSWSLTCELIPPFQRLSYDPHSGWRIWD